MKNQNSKNSEEKMVEKSTKYIDSFRKNIDMLMAKYDYTIKETAEIADISRLEKEMEEFRIDEV